MDTLHSEDAVLAGRGGIEVEIIWPGVFEETWVGFGGDAEA